jgi:dTDP-4-dehydrorhamnose reductase
LINLIKILVTGGNGQLGSELRSLSLIYSQFQWIFTDVKELDLLDLNNLENNISKISPNIIINCAAYTNVDKAESEIELANILNFKAVDLISKWSSVNKKKLIHISTDYVFDGNSIIPLNEDALTFPINVYGSTKLEGEKVCLKNDKNSIIIRTSWVYSSFGKNFVKTMFSLMDNRNLLSVVNDQIGSPTYAADLAKTILKIVSYKNWIPGLYHYSNEGEISWFEFANSIKEACGFRTKINGISTLEYSTPAKRPKYSLLDKSKIKETFNIEIPYYKESLEKCIQILKNEK